MTAVDHAELKRVAECLHGPHEWGYRDPVEGGFIEDDRPYRASEALYALLSEIEGLKAERDRLKLAICGGEDVPGSINAVTVEDCERFIREERQVATDLRPVWVGVDPACDAPEDFKKWADAFNLRTQASDSWRPIETAPEDGVIVGWGEYRERDGFSPAFMRHYESCGWSVNAMPFYPTHWMPLPAAPALRPQTAESGT